MFMHGACQVPEAGDEFVLVNAELPGRMLPVPANIGMTGDDQAHASGR